MIRRINKRKYDVYAFDVESHNDAESIAKNETSIWLGSFINEESKIDDPKSYIYTIEEFLTRLESLANKKPINHKRQVNNICVYVFNLSFEWSFILPVLLKQGYKYKEVIDYDNDERVYNSVSTRSCSSVWSISLKMNKKGGRILFRDLNKIYAGSLRSVAKSFNLETQKGEIDYTKNRLHNYIVTDEERAYCFKDTRIVMEILEKVGDDPTFWNASSSAGYSVKTGLRFAYPTALKPYNAFRKDYPILDQAETAFLREGVGGGITYAPPRYQFRVIKDGLIHVDLHQAHPSSLALNYFPYGKGTYFKGEPPRGKISACRIRIGYTFVKLHCIIKLIGIPFIEGLELVVWNFEIPLMKQCYEGLTIEYIEGYAYNMKPSPFAKYMKYNYARRLEAKKKGDKYNTLRYKLLNNSFYGKLLERPHNIAFENTINEAGIITSLLHEKGDEEREISGHYAYIPLGSCIPAYTRRTLVSTALLFGWRNIVYFDTDSIFMLDNEETRAQLKKLDLKDHLGGWGIEDEAGITKAQFTAPKRYKMEVGGRLQVKAGGINFSEYMLKRNKEKHGDNVEQYDDLASVPFEEINITCSSWEVKRAYRCKGGTLIALQRKEMDIQDKYKDIYKLNTKEK